MYSMATDWVRLARKKPSKNSTAPIRTDILALSLPLRRPHSSEPMQNRIMTMVKVRLSCAFVQLVNSAAMGVLSTLHAYTRPANSSTITPTMA